MEEQTKTNRDHKKTLRIIGGTVLMVVAYTIGCKVTKKSIANSIQQVWAVDPTLKDHMWDAVAKIGKQS